MELLDENRIIVRYGLSHMKHTENEGLRALMEGNNIEPEKLTAYTIGFVLGPCINAVSYTHLDVYKRQELAGYQDSQSEQQIISTQEFADMKTRMDSLSQAILELENRLKETCLLSTSRCV